MAEKEITRRTFVKGLAAGVASIAALGVLEKIGNPSTGSSEAPAASSADESSEVRLPLIGWSDLVFEGGKGFLIPRTFGFANAAENYEVRVNSGVRDALTAYREPSTGVVTVYSSSDGVVKNEPLFSLVTKLQTELDKDDTFTFSRQNGDIIVFGSITSAGKALKYTDDMVAKNIVFY